MPAGAHSIQRRLIMGNETDARYGRSENRGQHFDRLAYADNVDIMGGGTLGNISAKRRVFCRCCWEGWSSCQQL